MKGFLLTSAGIMLLVIGAAACWTAEQQEFAELVEKDWILQDTGQTRARIDKRVVAKVLAGLREENADLRRRFEQISREPDDEERWLDLYGAAARARRAERLEAITRQTDTIVFTKHFNMGGSHYAYTEALSDAQHQRYFIPGSALCLLTVRGADTWVTTLLDDEDGVIRDPDVSYDGKRILFSWKKSDRGDDYHLYEMDVDTRKLRALTEGLGWADYEGIYLPDGNIMFNSTRCMQIVDCWWTEVSNFYLCDRDGRYMRRIGFDQVHTNYPQVMDDGRVIYTRWDYNDRGQLFPQPLFRMNIDGTGQQEFYGNASWFPTTLMHARGIPGSHLVVAVASGHHTYQNGKLCLVDVSRGRQEASGVQLIAPKRETRAVRIDRYGQDGPQWQYPYPLNEREFIVTFAPDGMGKGVGIYYMDIDGNRELLAADPRLPCNQPVLLKARKKPPVRPSMVDYRRKTGTYSVQDIYSGPGLQGIERGTIKKLRVVGLEFRAAGIGSNRNSGPAGNALVSTPVSVDNGAWDPKIMLGETRIHDDGSAYFEAPARTPLYFQAIDGKGQVVQSMRTWSTLMPGEHFSCVGCHEDKNSAPPTGGPSVTMAMRAGPQKLEPWYGPARGFSFPGEIQPILDRHCIRCHDQRGKVVEGGGRRPAGDDDPAAAAFVSEGDGRASATGTAPVEKAFSLLGLPAKGMGKGERRQWSDAYVALTSNKRMVNWLNVQSVPQLLSPYHAGSCKSGLLAMLREGHNEVKLTREELEKIACWIDLLVPYCGDYLEANDWNEEEYNKYMHFLQKREEMAEIEFRNIEAFIESRTGAAFKLDRPERLTPAR